MRKEKRPAADRANPENISRNNSREYTPIPPSQWDGISDDGIILVREEVRKCMEETGNRFLEMRMMHYAGGDADRLGAAHLAWARLFDSIDLIYEARRAAYYESLANGEPAYYESIPCESPADSQGIDGIPF